MDADFEKAEIKVKGVIDVIKIHKLIQKTSQKKVELISPPLIKIKEIGAIAKETNKEIKEKEVSGFLNLTFTNKKIDFITIEIIYIYKKF